VVEADAGEEVLLYVGDDGDRVYPTRDRLDRDLWHRRLFLRPDVDGWAVWQFTGRGTVDGIDGPVDINVVRQD
jgi:lysozyme